MSKTEPMTVKIFNKEFQISCPEGKEAVLYEAAEYLDHKMKAIRAASRTVGAEKIAVMAALNMASELLATKSEVVRLHTKILQAVLTETASADDAELLL